MRLEQVSATFEISVENDGFDRIVLPGGNDQLLADPVDQIAQVVAEIGGLPCGIVVTPFWTG